MSRPTPTDQASIPGDPSSSPLSPAVSGFTSVAVSCLPDGTTGAPFNRGRTGMACNYCRSRKIKCSGGSVCSTCIRHSKTCVYTPVDEQANQQARERKALYRARMKQRLGSTNTKGSKRGADRTIQLESEPSSSSGQRRSSAYRHEYDTCCASCKGKQAQPEPVSIRACNGHVCHAVCHETLPLAGWSSPFTRRQKDDPISHRPFPSVFASTPREAAVLSAVTDHQQTLGTSVSSPLVASSPSATFAHHQSPHDERYVEQQPDAYRWQLTPPIPTGPSPGFTSFFPSTFRDDDEPSLSTTSFPLPSNMPFIRPGTMRSASLADVSTLHPNFLSARVHPRSLSYHDPTPASTASPPSFYTASQGYRSVISSAASSPGRPVASSVSSASSSSSPYSNPTYHPDVVEAVFPHPSYYYPPDSRSSPSYPCTSESDTSYFPSQPSHVMTAGPTHSYPTHLVSYPPLPSRPISPLNRGISNLLAPSSLSSTTSSSSGTALSTSDSAVSSPHSSPPLARHQPHFHPSVAANRSLPYISSGANELRGDMLLHCHPSQQSPSSMMPSCAAEQHLSGSGPHAPQTFDHELGSWSGSGMRHIAFEDVRRESSLPSIDGGHLDARQPHSIQEQEAWGTGLWGR